jgi:hypothetical protein
VEDNFGRGQGSPRIKMSEDKEERFPLRLENEIKPFKLTNDSSHVLEDCICSSLLPS